MTQEKMFMLLVKGSLEEAKRAALKRGVEPLRLSPVPRREEVRIFARTDEKSVVGWFNEDLAARRFEAGSLLFYNESAGVCVDCGGGVAVEPGRGPVRCFGCGFRREVEG